MKYFYERCFLSKFHTLPIITSRYSFGRYRQLRACRIYTQITTGIESFRVQTLKNVNQKGLRIPALRPRDRRKSALSSRDRGPHFRRLIRDKGCPNASPRQSAISGSLLLSDCATKAAAIDLNYKLTIKNVQLSRRVRRIESTRIDWNRSFPLLAAVLSNVFSPQCGNQG